MSKEFENLNNYKYIFSINSTLFQNIIHRCPADKLRSFICDLIQGKDLIDCLNSHIKSEFPDDYRFITSYAMLSSVSPNLSIHVVGNTVLPSWLCSICVSGNKNK